MSELMYALLDVLMQPAAIYALVCVCLALAGLSMMIVNVVRGRVPRV